ncbi:anti-phage-associated DUF1156 domain-containing protein [Halomonas sp. AOP43-D1-39]|uniref:anti-phage-associated DUF1156 domain-containing protein n=1 Tax=Halomonas TaxID=2745 RepID=UPI0018695518|nr:anti-phage-associated DUF1156 domain-containing protein [Halomonas colorata]
MDATTQLKPAELVPFALKDAPALIEKVFPATKVSFEAKKERDAGSSQTLPSLGSYWWGRKPLILVRSILLGSLLPETGDSEKDLAVYESLLGIDLKGMAKRAVKKDSIKPSDVATTVSLHNPWAYFDFDASKSHMADEDVSMCDFPIDANGLGIKIRWKRSVSLDSKAYILQKYLKKLGSYEERAAHCMRPEKVNEDFLLSHCWTDVNSAYRKYGVNAQSIPELIKQLGILRFGRNPIVTDTFSGGGSIPFESARMGADTVGADLNPIACMLNWGGFNIIGANDEKRKDIEREQKGLDRKVEAEILRLGIEVNDEGHRAKAYLYCLETVCPETGWRVPMSSTWLISWKYRAYAKLVPDHKSKRFDIEVAYAESNQELIASKNGTVSNGKLVYSIDNTSYSIPIKSLRGDRKGGGNDLRMWKKTDIEPISDDIFQERLYAVQWMIPSSKGARPYTYFASATDADLRREKKVSDYVHSNLEAWQTDGLIPDMTIEPGKKTDEPIRTRGWTHWHHLFNPRGLLLQALKKKFLNTPENCLRVARDADRLSKLCRYNANPQPSQGPKIEQVFSDQAINALYNYATYSFHGLESYIDKVKMVPVHGTGVVLNTSASVLPDGFVSDLYITDPPYADAVVYHELTEFFISWLRSSPPAPFDQWNWDSRRNLAIKGSGDDFRRGMVDAYKAMAEHMPDNGMQCVMFTHQDTGVWSDMVGIFWAAGLQVVGAWYIATEKTSELKKGGYVQGTVILMLRKRPEGDRKGFTRRIYPAVHKEVENQIEEMLHLNQQVEDHSGEPVFNDADLQMAGYAAALKVLTAYTEIGGEDVTSFAMRPRQKGEKTVVDEIVQQASETANGLLVPDGLKRDTWQSINGIQRFYLRMLDIETTGASKLDNYQNFAKAFRVEDYARVMASSAANKARLKQVEEMSSRDLMDSTELGATHLGRLMVAIQQLLADVDIKVVVQQLADELPDYFEKRGELIDMAKFLAVKATHEDVRDWADVLGDRISNEQMA